ncbi:MAG: hypothetical protein NTX59_13570 [Elusimicrobia bacterium]|nr:hypothetical protein [Elusimicrobiota bacterium]
MKNNERPSLWQLFRDELHREHKGMAAYTRLGIVSYYAILVIFTFIEKIASTEGFFIGMGRILAVAVLVALFMFSTSESSVSDIEGTLNEGNGGGYTDWLWHRASLVLLLASLIATAYEFYRGNIWGGVLYLGYPAWKCWLMLELRRTRISHAMIRTWRGWRTVLMVCGTGAAIFAVLLFLTGGGPYLPTTIRIQIYPAGLIVCLLGVVFSVIAAGDDLLLP